MREFVGVRDFTDIIVASHHDPGGLKRGFLVFDRIAVPLLGLQCKAIRRRGRKDLPVYVRELDWLLDKGMVFEPEAKFPDSRLMSDEEYKKYYSRASEVTELLEETTGEVSKRSKQYERVIFAQGVIAS